MEPAQHAECRITVQLANIPIVAFKDQLALEAASGTFPTGDLTCFFQTNLLAVCREASGPTQTSRRCLGGNHRRTEGSSTDTKPWAEGPGAGIPYLAALRVPMRFSHSGVVLDMLLPDVAP